MQLNQSMKDILKNPFLILLSLLVFINPLVMSSDTNELFEFPKMFFVYFIGIAIITLFLINLVLREQTLVWPSKPVLLFLLVSAGSTIMSSYRYTSFWGYYSRFNGGLLSLIIFVGIYFVCINKLKSGDFVNLMKISCLTIFPVGLVGVIQHFGFGTGVVERVYSTIGQPNWLAQYLVMILPFAMYLFVTGFSIFWAFLFIVGFSCLWFTYSMSGIAGFVVASLMMSIVFYRKKMLNIKTLLRIKIAYLICLIIALTNLGLFKDKFSDALKDFKSKVLIEKAYALEKEYKVSDPGYIRFGLWKGAINLFLSSPKIFMIGTGPETFPYSFQPFRPTGLNYSSEWDFVFNKPHNYYLQVLTETGLAGFMIYLYLLLKLVRKSPYYLLPGLLGFIVTNAFGWPVVSTSLLFWIWLSWAEKKFE